MSLLLLALGTAQSADKATGDISGTVVEALNAASYTYVQVDTGKEKIWAAGPQVEVKAGDKVSFPSGMLMEKFESKTLKRTFDRIYFVDRINTPGTMQPTSEKAAANSVPNDDAHRGLKMPSGTQAKAVDFAGIKKPQGGLTVGEIFEQKAKLVKKQVMFRGRVVKYNSQIMNKNWVHVQDGTGIAGANDVTVTTEDAAKIGDTVLVKGTVSLNKDYGHGYKYDLVVEDAKVTVESQ